MTEYESQQLAQVERVVKRISERARVLKDRELTHHVQWLIEDVLFLRTILMSTPPGLTSGRLRAIINHEDWLKGQESS